MLASQQFRRPITWASLKLAQVIGLLNCWDYRHEPSHSTSTCFKSQITFFSLKFPKFLHRIRKNYFKFYMEPKKSPYSQDNPKHKEQSWRHHITWLQTILQVYSNQNSMVLVPKGIYRPREQNRDLRNNTMYLQPSDLQQTWQKQAMGKESPI